MSYFLVSKRFGSRLEMVREEGEEGFSGVTLRMERETSYWVRAMGRTPKPL